MTVVAWQSWLTGALVAAAVLFAAWHVLYGRRGC